MSSFYLFTVVNRSTQFWRVSIILHSILGESGTEPMVHILVSCDKAYLMFNVFIDLMKALRCWFDVNDNMKIVKPFAYSDTNLQFDCALLIKSPWWLLRTVVWASTKWLFPVVDGFLTQMFDFQDSIIMNESTSSNSDMAFLLIQYHWYTWYTYC